MKKQQLLQASQSRIDIAVTVISERDGDVVLMVKPLLNLTFILMLIWQATTAINYLLFSFALLAIYTQQAIDAPVKVAQVWGSAWAFGIGLVS